MKRLYHFKAGDVSCPIPC